MSAQEGVVQLMVVGVILLLVWALRESCNEVTKSDIFFGTITGVAIVVLVMLLILVMESA